jgi:hypothetical protein
MRLDASYNLCSKSGSKLIFGRHYGNFSFAIPFLDFDCIFLSDLFLKVGPDKIYANLKLVLIFSVFFNTKTARKNAYFNIIVLIYL